MNGLNCFKNKLEDLIAGLIFFVMGLIFIMIGVTAHPAVGLIFSIPMILGSFLFFAGAFLPRCM